MKLKSREKPLWLRLVLVIFWGVVTFVLLRVEVKTRPLLLNLWNKVVVNNTEDALGVFETAGFYFQFLIMCVMTILFIYVIKMLRPILKTFGTKFKGNNWKMALVGLAIGLVSNMFCAVAAIMHGDIKLSFSNFNIGAFILLIVVVTIQCAAEELLCRGLLLQMTAKYFRSPIIICIMNPLLFSIAHLWNPGINAMALISIFLVAIQFTVMVYYFDSFWGAVGIHTGWNFCQSILLGLPNSGHVFPYSHFKLDWATANKTIFYDPEFGIEGTVMSLIANIVSTIIICYIGIKKKYQMTDIWEENQVDAVEE